MIKVSLIFVALLSLSDGLEVTQEAQQAESVY